jgi:Predicted solute binding protein
LIKHKKREGVLLILMITLAITACGAVTAHPGHGTPIEEPSDPGTGSSTDTGTTSTGTTSSSGTTSASSSSGSGSTSYSSSSKSSGSSNGGTGTEQTTTTDTPTTNNNATTTSTSGPEEVTGNTGSSTNSPGGPIAMIGLMVVVGLIAMSFPYNEGGALGRLQMRLFGVDKT